jgi:hypothetical protein
MGIIERKKRRRRGSLWEVTREVKVGGVSVLAVNKKTPPNQRFPSIPLPLPGTVNATLKYADGILGVVESNYTA